MLNIVAGWDPREILGYGLCAFSAMRRSSRPLRIVPLIERSLRQSGLYRRPHEMREGRLWCPISDAPMATAFANSRFLSPWLGDGADWLLFADFADMLFLDDPADLFALRDERYAVQVVKHRHAPSEIMKMDAQAQTRYARKNWSSVILFNLDHPANQRLTLEMVNTLPGRDLHRFCWLEDHEIGELPARWNHLVGYTPEDEPPGLLHFTVGTVETGVWSGKWSGLWLQELSLMDATRANIIAATVDSAA